MISTGRILFFNSFLQFLKKWFIPFIRTVMYVCISSVQSLLALFMAYHYSLLANFQQRKNILGHFNGFRIHKSQNIPNCRQLQPPCKQSFILRMLLSLTSRMAIFIQFISQQASLELYFFCWYANIFFLTNGGWRVCLNIMF